MQTDSSSSLSASAAARAASRHRFAMGLDDAPASALDPALDDARDDTLGRGATAVGGFHPRDPERNDDVRTFFAGRRAQGFGGGFWAVAFWADDPFNATGRENFRM